MSGGQPSNQPHERHDDLFRLLVESVQDYAIFLLDPAGHVLTWNDGAQRIKGYGADEIIGRHFSIFYPAPDVRRGKPEHVLQAAAEDGRFVDESWRVRKDGSTFWASVVVTALHDNDGKLVGFAKVTRDLTERKLAEEERVQLLTLERAARAEAAVAEATLRARDEFLAVAAHELKTPMTSLRLSAQMLLRRLEVEETPDMLYLHRAIRTVDQQVDKLARLVTQLLEATRSHEGRLELQRARTNVAEVVRNVLQLMQALTDRHQLQLSGADPVWGFVDELRVEHVISNLLDNAIKFSPGGGRIDVALTQPAPDMIRLAVRDRGLGVPPDQRLHLFERFFQAHAGDYRSGMGLGLFICREIVELHGGTIAAEFPSDGGTRFVVDLPTGLEESGQTGKGSEAHECA